ncbi:hypothetical protein [Catenulispora rubra]|uniref:hypothetical protein n=1 Tax=Catenulispora rubra TaxID=280293 RepID=UPI00189220DD|nr:hypothetical protein [Catenulispora rubra]
MTALESVSAAERVAPELPADGEELSVSLVRNALRRGRLPVPISSAGHEGAQG